MKFRGHAFGLVSPRRTKLLFRHDPNVVAGAVEQLSYDEYGRLKIRCRVDHEQARRCRAFSVSARINEYRLCDVDTPNFFAEVIDANFDEVSLTDLPANSRALVTSCFPADARSKFLGDLLEWTGALQKFVTLVPQVVTTNTDHGPLLTAASPSASRRKSWPTRGEHMIGANFAARYVTKAPEPSRRPTSRGSFSELAARLNQMEA